MTTPCGILGCPHLYTEGRDPIIVAYENDFGVAIEQSIKVCDDHLTAVVQVTQRANESQRTAQKIANEAMARASNASTLSKMGSSGYIKVVPRDG